MNIKLLDLNGNSFLDDFVHDTNSDSRHFSRVDQMEQILAAVNPNGKELLRNIEIGTQRKSFSVGMTLLLLGDSDPSDFKLHAAERSLFEFLLFQMLTKTFGKLYRVRISSVMI